MGERHDFASQPVVLDIDGTICENGHRLVWDDPWSVKHGCRPFPDAQARVAAMLEAGWSPCFVSARCSVLGGVTYRQLEAWLGPDCAQRADILLSDIDSHRGLTLVELNNWVVAEKAGLLQDLARQSPGLIYVGDTVQDVLACARAGVRFMWADRWRAGRAFAHAEDAGVLQASAEARARA